MASFKITGQMKVKTLKENFKTHFNSVLRIYDKNHFADENKTLAAIRNANAKGGEFECGDQDTVGNFENFMKDLYGIKVQVASPDDSRLVDDNMKLGDVKNIGKIKRRGAKKKMKFIFNGEEFTIKGRLCQSIVKYYAEEHPEARIGDLQELFHVHNKVQVVMLKEDAKNVPDYKGVTGKSYYLDGVDDIEIRGGIASVWNYWPKKYFNPFMKIVDKLGYEVEVIDLDKNEEESFEPEKEYEIEEDTPMKTLTINLHAHGVYEFNIHTINDVESVKNVRSINDDYDDFSSELQDLINDDDVSQDCECFYTACSVEGVSVDDENWDTVFESEDNIDVITDVDAVKIDEDYDDIECSSVLSNISEGNYVAELVDLGSCDLCWDIEIPEDEDFDISKLKLIRNTCDHIDICNHYDEFDKFLSTTHIIYDGKVYENGNANSDGDGSYHTDFVEIAKDEQNEKGWMMKTADVD